MSGPNELLEFAQAPDEEITIRLNALINDELAGYSDQTRTLWLFMLATEYYKELDPNKFDLSDYQIAADMVGE